MIIPATLAYLGLALLLYDTAMRSWRFAGRVDDPAVLHARPAPAVGRHRLGPAVPSRRLVDDPVRGWTVDESGLAELVEHKGATADWSPKREVAAVERRALPLDDVDEWLAERTRQYEHALSRIGCRAVSLVKGEVQATLDETLRRFQQGSMALHAYRMLILDSTGSYGPREHMELEALLLAEV